MSSQPAPPLSQGAGYGVIIGLGAFFAIVGFNERKGMQNRILIHTILSPARSSLVFHNPFGSMLVSLCHLPSIPLHLDLLVLV